MWRRKKDYLVVKRHSGANPFLRSSEHPRRHMLLLVGILVVCFVVTGYVIMTYPALQISSVTINGATTVSRDTVDNAVKEFLRKKRWGILPQHSTVLFSKNALVDYLRAQFNFSAVQIDRIGITALVVTVTQQDPAVTILNGTQRLYVSPEGTVIRSEVYEPVDYNLIIGGDSTIRKQAPELRYPEILYLGTIEGVNDQTILNQRVLEPSLVAFVSQLHQTAVNMLNVTVARYELQSASIDTLTMETVEGWRVYFKINDQPDAQVERLRILLAQKIKNTAELDYVDLRYDDKVFYQ